MLATGFLGFGIIIDTVNNRQQPWHCKQITQHVVPDSCVQQKTPCPVANLLQIGITTSRYHEWRMTNWRKMTPDRNPLVKYKSRPLQAPRCCFKLLVEGTNLVQQPSLWTRSPTADIISHGAKHEFKVCRGDLGAGFSTVLAAIEHHFEAMNRVVDSIASLWAWLVLPHRKLHVYLMQNKWNEYSLSLHSPPPYAWRAPHPFV